MSSPLDSFKSLVEANGGVGAIDLILKWIHKDSSKVARERLDQFQNDHPNNPFQGKDKYGVIPYFDQIGEPMEVLGHG
jgi:hypothetical protein